MLFETKLKLNVYQPFLGFVRIVTGCLRPTPTNHLLILSGILPAELADYKRHYPWLAVDLWILIISCMVFNGSSDARQEGLRFRRPFVPAARNLLNNIAGLGIRASQRKNYKWNTE